MVVVWAAMPIPMALIRYAGRFENRFNAFLLANFFLLGLLQSYRYSFTFVFASFYSFRFLSRSISRSPHLLEKKQQRIELASVRDSTDYSLNVQLNMAVMWMCVCVRGFFSPWSQPLLVVVQHVRWCWRWYTIIKISLWFLHYMHRIRGALQFANCIFSLFLVFLLSSFRL